VPAARALAQPQPRDNSCAVVRRHRHTDNPIGVGNLADVQRPERNNDLSGVGDLMATCYSEHSRNHRVGLLLGQGRSLEDILSGTRMVAEGVLNTASLHRAAKQKGVRMPLLDEIYAILHEGKPAKEVMRTLFSRDPRPEAD
jgi:glycerol-3-phosphate dehydrogenase (NAD(P)+)